MWHISLVETAEKGEEQSDEGVLGELLFGLSSFAGCSTATGISQLKRLWFLENM